MCNYCYTCGSSNFIRLCRICSHICQQHKFCSVWIFWQFSVVEEQCIYNCFFPQQFPYFCDINHFTFVAVHHHGRRDDPAGHRHHVPAPQDGVHPDPHPGGGAVAAAATLLCWQVSHRTTVKYLACCRKYFVAILTIAMIAVTMWPTLTCYQLVSVMQWLDPLPSTANFVASLCSVPPLGDDKNTPIANKFVNLLWES